MLDRPNDEEAILAELQAAGALDSVPVEMAAAARASFAWRTMDAELADLTYDSLLDDEALAGVRSTAPPRFLTFAAADLTVEVEASEGGGRRRLMGQLVPPQPGEIEVRHSGGTSTVAADELGRFSVADLPPGPVSLYCRTTADGPTVTTDWVIV